MQTGILWKNWGEAMAAVDIESTLKLAAKLVTWKKEQPISEDGVRGEFISPDDRVRQEKAKRKEKKRKNRNA